MDARPSMASAIAAFGVPVVMLRPDIGATPVTTSGIFCAPLVEEWSPVTDLSKHDPRRVLAIPRAATVPVPVRATVFLAAEEAGGEEKTWRFDGLQQPLEVDCYRVIVVPVLST